MSYKKFLSSAATATLVASAIVPVASAATFTDVTDDNSHKVAIETLSEMGIVKGYEDGTYKPEKQLLRSNVVKMIGRWLETEGYTIPSDWNTKQRFLDLPVDFSDQELVKYAALVMDQGVFTGSNKKLLHNTNMTRSQIALVLNRVYEKLYGVSLVDLAEDIEDEVIEDMDEVFEDRKAAVQALRDLKISNVRKFQPNAPVTRAQFASFIYRTLQLNESDTETYTTEVKSVSAVNANTLQVEFTNAIVNEATNLQQVKVYEKESGKALDSLTYTLSEDGKTLTITNNGFFNGEYEVVVPNDTVKAVKGFVTGYQQTVKVEAGVQTVQALTTTIDRNAKEAVLEFAINGSNKPASLAKLQEAGYQVEFQATKAVFADSSKTSATGVLAVKNQDFKYKVVIFKDGEVVAESAVVEVKSLDYSKVPTEITSFELQNDGVVLTSNVFTLNDAAPKIANVKGTLKNGKVDQPLSDITYSSSNPGVALIKADGTIELLSAGTTTFTIKAGDVQKSVTVEVKDATRTATTVTANTNEVKLVNGASTTVALTVKDQFGDPLKGYEIVGDAPVTVSTEETTPTAIATVAKNAETHGKVVTDEKGEAVVKVTALPANAKGVGNFAIKEGTTTLFTLPITVDEVGEVAYRKLELVDGEDLILDLNPLEKDQTLKVAYNQYNKAGYLIGKEILGDNKTYQIKSSDTNVITVSSNGTVTAVGTGTAKVQIFEGGIKVDELTVTVINTNPTLSTVTFNNDLKVTSSEAVTLDQWIKSVELTKDVEVSFDVNGSNDKEIIVYVETSSKANGYTVGSDILLGTISIASADVALSGFDRVDSAKTYNLTDIQTSFSRGNNGQVVLVVKKAGSASALASTTVDVKVPAE